MTMEPCFFDRFTVFLTSPSWARTSDNTVNSRALYQLSYRGSFLFILSLFSFDYSSDVPSKLHTEPFIKHLPYLLWLKPRPISNSQLHTLPYFHLCPIYLVVFKGSYCFRMGYLILRGASRLDAFSVYPFPAWLLCHAPGDATDPPAAGPSRSSRTKDSSSQISYAHAG